MSEELKTPVSQTIEYADGTKTVISYTALGDRHEEVVEAPVVKSTKVKVKVIKK